MNGSSERKPVMSMSHDRRTVIAGLGAFGAGFALSRSLEAQTMNASADLILFNGRITTLRIGHPG
jgi:hypothetical protein